VTGLAGTGLVLVNNGTDLTAINANGAFTLAQTALNLSAFSVTISAQPTGPAQVCTISNGGGRIDGAHVTTLVVNCVTPQVLGTRLGYVRQVRGTDGQLHEELFSNRPDGSDERQLTHDSTSLYVNVRWSRNGRFIAYCKPDLTTTIRDRSCQLFLRDGDGSHERFVDFGGDPSFSEDSTKLLYTRTFQTSTLTQERLFLLDLASEQATAVIGIGGGPDLLNAVISSDRMRNPVFGPDSRYMVYFGHTDDLHGVSDPAPKLHQQIGQIESPSGGSVFGVAMSAESLCSSIQIPTNLWTSPRGFLYFSCGARLWEVALTSGVHLGARMVPGFNYPEDLGFASSPDGNQVAVSDSLRILIYNYDFDPATLQFPAIYGTGITLGGWFTP